MSSMFYRKNQETSFWEKDKFLTSFMVEMVQNSYQLLLFLNSKIVSKYLIITDSNGDVLFFPTMKTLKE